MHKIILFGILTVMVSCRPQQHLRNFRPSAPVSSIPRQPHFFNSAPAPVQSIEPQHISSTQFLHRKPISPSLSQFQLEQEADGESEKQNYNAQYQFSSNIEDHINDQSQQREETRDGLSVKGSYSYSDGYYKRIVEYIADKDGYRVTRMEATPLDGPHIDLMGTASVSNSAHGSQLNYKVVSIPVEGPVGKIVNHEQ